MARAVITDLLDRDAELAQIVAAVESARAGTGGALIVEGVAGIGKTSLLDHARGCGSQAGMTVLAASGRRVRGGLRLGRGPSAVRSIAPRWVCGRRAAERGRLAGRPALGASSELIGVDEDAFAVLHGLYWLTANLAELQPVLVAVDDLHWSDQPSLRLIAHLTRRLEGLPVLLMATTRPPRSRAKNAGLLPAIIVDPGVRVVRPAALGSTSCSVIVGAGLGGDPSPDFGQACEEVTGGNPFLLHALVDGLAVEGVQGGDRDVAHVRYLPPRAVTQDVLLRLGRMPPEALAVAGRWPCSVPEPPWLGSRPSRSSIRHRWPMPSKR